MKKKYAFKDCTLILLEELFQLRQIRDMPLLVDWLAYEVEVSAGERQVLSLLQENLMERN